MYLKLSSEDIYDNKNMRKSNSFHIHDLDVHSIFVVGLHYYFDYFLNVEKTPPRACV